MNTEKIMKAFIEALERDEQFYGKMRGHLVLHILEGGVFDKYNEGEEEEEIMIISKEEFNELSMHIANDFLQCLLGYPNDIDFSEN